MSICSMLDTWHAALITYIAYTQFTSHHGDLEAVSKPSWYDIPCMKQSRCWSMFYQEQCSTCQRIGCFMILTQISTSSITPCSSMLFQWYAHPLEDMTEYWREKQPLTDLVVRMYVMPTLFLFSFNTACSFFSYRIWQCEVLPLCISTLGWCFPSQQICIRSPICRMYLQICVVLRRWTLRA